MKALRRSLSALHRTLSWAFPAPAWRPVFPPSLLPVPGAGSAAGTIRDEWSHGLFLPAMKHTGYGQMEFARVLNRQRANDDRLHRLVEPHVSRRMDRSGATARLELGRAGTVRVRPLRRSPPSLSFATLPLDGAQVVGQLLPLVRGLVAMLDAGADVLQPQCGEAQVLGELARRFPRSRFVGTGSSAVAGVRTQLSARTEERPNFRLLPPEPAGRPLGAAYDAALVLGDARRPLDPGVLASVTAQLKPGGVLLMSLAGPAEPSCRRLPDILWAYGLILVHTAELAVAPAGFACIARR